MSDPLALETGLPEGIATTTNARFERDAKVRDGEVLLLKLDFEFEDSEVETTTQFYSLGEGWDSHDKGRTAEHESGRENKNFHSNSKIGTLIKAMMAGGAEDAMRQKLEADGSNLQTASFYDGWTFDWYRKETELKFKDRTTGDMVETVMVDFIPRDDSLVEGKAKGKAASKKAAKAPAKKAATKKSEPVEDERPYAISDEVAEKLYELAYGAEDADSYQELAYVEIEDATEDASIAAAIDDLDSDFSIWAKAQADWEAVNGVE